MRHPQRQTEESRISKILEEAEQTIARANEALENAAKFFADHNIDPEKMKKEMLAREGSRGEKEMHAQVENALAQARQEAERKLMEQRFDVTTTRQSRRTRKLV